MCEQVRLHISNVFKDRPGYSLIGGADFGAAITKNTKRVCDALAEAMRHEGFTNALLVLDAEDVARIAGKEASALGPDYAPAVSFE
jgi:hypothetical protein